MVNQAGRYDQLYGLLGSTSIANEFLMAVMYRLNIMIVHDKKS